MANINGYLENIKSAASGETVRDSIISCLRLINSDNPTTIKPLNVTANGTYTSQTGFAYNPVTVNVPTGGSSSYTFEELEVTENGEYEPEEEDTMYSKVTVNVPQFAKDIMPDTFTITQNGEYDPIKDGYDGYGKLIINVDEVSGDGPFTVKFYDSDKTSILQTSQVDKYASAIFNPTKGYPTPPVGQMFCGWEPNPINVTRDLKCYPNFQPISIVVGEISDDWAVICGNGGMGYPLGSFKSLPFGATIPQSEIQAINPNYSRGDVSITFIGLAIKVAEGESGTNSSWLWIAQNDGGGGLNFYLGDNLDYMLWTSSMTRNFLNTVFLNHMSDIFKAAIKPVIKYTQNSPRNTAPFEVVPTQDYIWIPSVKEMMGTNDDLIYLVGAYGEETQFQTNYNKYYTQVPQSIAYFRDNLQMTAAERDATLMRTGTTAPLRDVKDSINNYISLMSNEDTSIRVSFARHTYQYAPSWFREEYRTSYPILGFCM
jgi:hypothetical protein